MLATLGDVIATDRTELDLAKPDSICKAVRELMPTFDRYPAAYIPVDNAVRTCMYNKRARRGQS